MKKSKMSGSRPASPAVLQARAFHANGRLGEARQAWQQISVQESLNPEPHMALADIAFRAGDLPVGLAHLDEAARRAPNEAQIPLMRATALVNSGALEAACDVLDALLQRKPRDSIALRMRGALAQRLGDTEAAIKGFEKAVRADRMDPEAQLGLGIALMSGGRADEALPRFARAVSLAPDMPVLHLNQAQALLDAGFPGRSLEASTKALSLAPGFIGALVLQARAYDALEDFDRARRAWMAAVAQSPEDPHVLSDAATYLSFDNDLPTALKLAEKAMVLAPEEPVFRKNFIALLIADGQLEQAEALVRDWVTDAPQQSAPVRVLADILVRKGQFCQARDLLMEGLSKHPDDDGLAVSMVATGKMDADFGVADAIVERAVNGLEAGNISAELAYAAGKIFDDRGEYSNAFRAYKAANDVRLAENPFDMDAHDALVDEVIATFTPALFDRLAGIGSESEKPIFVVGLPRSGTTLTEQIIASHPQASGAGEMTHFTRFEKSLPWMVGGLAGEPAGEGPSPYPACVSQLDGETVARFARSYLGEMDRITASKTRVVDKLPNNFLRLGLVHLVFPKAKIVHLKRDLLDTAVSLYFQNFVYAHGYRHDLRTLGRYIKSYVRLMDHWRRVLPVPLFDLDYGTLVSDPESEARRLLAFLGLPWDASVLSFHQRREQPVATASRWQVRQPISTRSLSRWRRYESGLGPLIEDVRGVLGDDQMSL